MNESKLSISRQSTGWASSGGREIDVVFVVVVVVMAASAGVVSEDIV